MSKDEFLQQYAKALHAQATAETQVKVLEMRAKLEFSTTAVEPKSRTQQYIDRQQIRDADYIEFLEKTECTTKEASIFLDVAERTVRRLLKKAKLSEGDSSTPNSKTIDTISVIDYLIHGETEKTP